MHIKTKDVPRTKEDVIKIVKKLNELWIEANVLSRGFSCRTTHIEILNDSKYIMKIYLNGNGDLGQYWHGDYFHNELNRLGWKIVNIGIEFKDSIAITLDLGDVF